MIQGKCLLNAQTRNIAHEMYSELTERADFDKQPRRACHFVQK